jgi:hypothetical protein
MVLLLDNADRARINNPVNERLSDTILLILPTLIPLMTEVGKVSSLALERGITDGVKEIVGM